MSDDTRVMSLCQQQTKVVRYGEQEKPNAVRTKEDISGERLMT